MKRMYDAARNGTYKHRKPNYDGTFSIEVVAVEVLGESEKLYLVRLKMPVGTHRQHDEMWVRKHNVRINTEAGRSIADDKYDYSGAYWNK